MIGAHTAWLFALLAFCLALSPGPNVMFLLAASLTGGRRAGLAALGGIASGMAAYLVVTVSGFGALFRLVPAAYDAVRWAGAMYLLLLAWRLWRGAVVHTTAPPGAHGVFARALLNCLLNPKIALMYGALLPQFLAPGEGTAALLELGVIQLAAAIAAQGLLLAVATRVRLRFAPGLRWVGIQRRLLAFALALLAVRVALARRPA